ncbi:MAG: hypothetical protein GF365_01440 [Candidatus Buchananbacteria bacterium]|nr:hypothetical protein [Candidatus Buchananbacteria bacterium]
MYLLFVDEIKEGKKDYEIYGLVAIYISNSSYGKFKKGFYAKLKSLGWNHAIEIKGRYSFSSSKGDKKISIEDRLIFVEKLFELSKTGSGKYAAAKVYYIFDIFRKGTSEQKMYGKLLAKILNKIPKGKKSGNKNGNNNIVIFLDKNDSINIKDVTNLVEDICDNRGLFLIERCFSIDSGNETPGIIFADHVAYFINNYFRVRAFNKKNKQYIQELLDKFSEKTLSDKEREYFLSLVRSIEKEDKTLKLLGALKKMIFVK